MIKKYKNIILIVVAALLCEVLLFNSKFFTTFLNEEVKYSISNKNGIVQITDIDREVNNIKINIDSENFTSISISAKDEANKNYYNLNTKYISSSNKRSLYQSIHASGKVDSLKIEFRNKNARVKDVIINPRIPLMFSIVRFAFILSVMLIIYLFRGKSTLYEIKFFECKNGLLYATIISFIVIITALVLSFNNKFFQSTGLVNQYQYYRLTEALRSKRLYIKSAENSFLMDMDNPYDMAEREKLSVEKNELYLWDYVFYKGKYYVYFGIGPVLLAYLPYNLLTNRVLSNITLDLFLILGSVFSILYLLYMICKKWFKDVKLPIFLLSYALILFSSGVMYVVKRPDFYEVPIIMSLFLVTLGLGLFISASMERKLFKTKLVVASLSMAFVALCRPQFLISTFLIVPLYYDYFFKKFDKEKAKEFACIIVPYLIIALITCAYNYLRFGSPFDFGANYNLTTNDMTKRGFMLVRIPLGIYHYLFAPTRINPVFPYIDSLPLINNFFGYTTYERMFGGFIYNHIIVLLSLFIFKFKNYFKDKKLYTICMLSVIFGLLVMMLDTQMAGILPRYLMDFSYLLLIPTVVIILTMESKILKYDTAKNILLALISMSIIYEVLFLFIDTSITMQDYMPNIFYYFYYLFTI